MGVVWSDMILDTNSNVSLKSWLEHRTLWPFSSSEESTEKKKKANIFPCERTETVLMLAESSAFMSNTITYSDVWLRKISFQDLCDFSIVEKSYWDKLLYQADSFFIAFILKHVWKRKYFCARYPHSQVIFQPYNSPTVCENIIPKYLHTCLHINEWCCVGRQRTAAPLNERMPTMCGCAQAFGAGMCWEAGSVFFPPRQLSQVLQGKENNQTTEQRRTGRK